MTLASTSGFAQNVEVTFVVGDISSPLNPGDTTFSIADADIVTGKQIGRAHV